MSFVILLPFPESGPNDWVKVKSALTSEARPYLSRHPLRLSIHGEQNGYCVGLVGSLPITLIRSSGIGGRVRPILGGFSNPLVCLSVSLKVAVSPLSLQITGTYCNITVSRKICPLSLRPAAEM